MLTKTCFKCGEVKSIDEFYRHSMMADGRLNKCKNCTKSDTKSNRATKHEYYLLYDRRRYDENPERKVSAAVWQSSIASSEQVAAVKQRWADKNVEKVRAEDMVHRAIRSGKLIRQPCEVCGSTDDVEAHHDDYNKPLDVHWLCTEHHGHTRRRSRGVVQAPTC